MRVSEMKKIMDAKPKGGTVTDDLRPVTFDQIVGQASAVSQLRLLTAAARGRNEALTHILIDGPPGLGKTTMAGAVANAMGGKLYVTTGQSVGLEQLGKILSTLPAGTIFMIDEIHGLSVKAETMLLGAMEDGVVDMTTPVGPERRAVKPFTLVGATTAPGDLSEPLKTRFGHQLQLNYYSVGDMIDIVAQSAERLGMDIGAGAVSDIAERANGTPRTANRFLLNVRDYAQVISPEMMISSGTTEKAFEFFEIDEAGLMPRDRQYVMTMYERFNGGPVGGENLAVALGMDVRTVQSDIEPLLMRLQLIVRAPRGRLLTDAGRAFAQQLLGL